MILVWRGAGLYTLLFYVMSLLAMNPDILLRPKSMNADDINWWVSALLTATFNFWLVRLAQQMKGQADTSTHLGRLFLRLGERHHIFWIPLQYWTAIFFALGLHGLYYAVLQ